VLRRICGTKRGRMAGGYSKLHNKELRNITWIKNFDFENLKGRDLLEDLQMDGKIVLE